MKLIFPLLTITLLLYSCKKEFDESITAPDDQGFVDHRIKAGQHFSDKSVYTPTLYRQLLFDVIFDSTAIYETVKPENQDDINKLYGFSDNGLHHHVSSARFGWRWSKKALRLFAYVYFDSELKSKEICAVDIGKIYRCGIRVEASRYLFNVNDIVLEMPRHGSSPEASGYQLYPYFGGDEPAPHHINIRIRHK